QVIFSNPVAISANTTYVASYHTNGHYVVDQNHFSGAGVDNGPLHALRDGVDGGNGVFAYGPTSLFPNSSFLASNYWVDVVFTTSVGPTSTPTLTPTATSTVQPGVCPCSIFGTSAPTNQMANDVGSVEVGIKFRSDTSGFVTGVRFYKDASNTGAH